MQSGTSGGARQMAGSSRRAYPTGQRSCPGDVEARPRPPYVHVLPLAQIIQTMEGASSPNTKKCRAIYSSFISTFGNEIAVLIDVPVAEIRTIHPKVADAIEALRSGHRHPASRGGGEWQDVRFRSSDVLFIKGNTAGILERRNGHEAIEFTSEA